jgi:hypothetical protein
MLLVGLGAVYLRKRIFVMGLAINAEFYRGYLTEDRSLVPLTIVLANGVALWLFFYLVSVAGPAPNF